VTGEQYFINDHKNKQLSGSMTYATRARRAHNPTRCIAIHETMMTLTYVLDCAHEQKAHGLQWVEAIGVANKNTAFAKLVGLAKRFEAQ
jgi:hypothetical protein